MVAASYEVALLGQRRHRISGVSYRRMRFQFTLDACFQH